MFKFLKNKNKGGESSSEKSPEEKAEGKPEGKEAVSKAPVSGGGGEDASSAKLAVDVERLKAGVEAFQEVRKAFTERFTRISEQIGELRSMILERDKSIQEIELKAIKAYDLVDSVHPEKVMSEVQKQNAKSEALKANLEGNEAIMNRVMEELKETKKKIEFFRGVDEIIKLSEEVKKELFEIKKLESKITIDADKVETIYSELRSKFQDVDQFTSQLQETKVGMEQNTKDVSFLKDKVTGLADKAEVEKLVNKVQRYIDALKDLQKKSSLTKDIEKIKTIIEGLK